MADDRKDPQNQDSADDREIRQEHQDEQGSPEFQKSSAGLAAPATGGQGAGTGGTIGGQMGDNEMGAQGAGFAQGESNAQGETSAGSQSPLGASHEQGADGGSVVAAGAASSGPGAGQAGIERGGGFIGSQSDERDPQQAGFAEQGRGAPDEGRDIERGGERGANRDSDIEGSSGNR